jgi:PEP-CTERM motif
MAAMIAPIREADAHRRPDNALAGAGDGCGAKFSRRAKRGNFLFKSDALRLWDCAEYRLVVADVPTCRGLRKICARALDPTNNDGTPSATVNVAASTGSVGFSNPAGTADDITLATGSLTHGSFGTQANGQPGVHFIETYTPAPGEAGFSVSPTGPHTSIEEFLFNTSTSRVQGTFADGSTYVVVNNGIGAADLLVPEPASITVLGAGLFALAAFRRHSKR